MRTRTGRRGWGTAPAGGAAKRGGRKRYRAPASGRTARRRAARRRAPSPARGVFCAIGRCTDCVMVVNGKPNVRTCVTPLEEGMTVQTQYGVSAKPQE
ncbi:MAG TPA: (2Fe-2S)-binding protein [Candidatus Butyricicoccus stercorigallinarum]|nr:(2Fe-2S)-binding protein [Candidatus Butyricicoccus stercorigallinarum]